MRSIAYHVLPLTISWVVIIPSAVAKGGDDSAELFEQVFSKGTSSSSYMNSDSVSSPDFDKWLKAYLNGDESKRQEHWSVVLKAARKDNSIHSLFKQAVVRISMSDANDNNPRRSPITALCTMIADSEHFVGKSDWLLHDGYDYSSYLCKGALKYDKAAMLKERELKLEETKYGTEDHTTMNSACDLAELQLNANQLDAARQVLNRLTKLDKMKKDEKVAARVKTLQDRLAQKLARRKQG